jgi:NAD(P)-dependent dehydrogenase (short-subunit alcohol dehydrogenase family)
MGGIDVLVNNAAVIDGQFTDELRLDELPVEVWDRVYAVNVRGTWLTMKYAVPYLEPGSNPAIVNCASVSGGILTFPGESCYGSTKAAVIHLTRTAALDFQPLGIRVTCYSPGTIGTQMVEEQIAAAPDPVAKREEFACWHLTPERRLGDPVEVARVVCFLASDDASFVNGADLRVDAGLSVWRGSF